MTYQRYRGLMPLPYPAAISHSGAAEQAVSVMPPAETAEPLSAMREPPAAEQIVVMARCQPEPAASHAETIALLEELLEQGRREFDDRGRDITDVSLIDADPPPLILRTA
jgi:hypothetical protein